MSKRPRGLWKSRVPDLSSALPRPIEGDLEATGLHSPLRKKRRRSADPDGDISLADPPEKSTVDLDDWEDLKELFANAVDKYESEDPASSLPLLRGVIHECDRFLSIYTDPSVIFAPQPVPQSRPPSRSPEQLTPPEKRLRRDWSDDETGPFHRSKATSPAASLDHPRDLPTAFHTIFGSALFLFGNLIAKNPPAALHGEPNSGAPYYLAAIDVFETGENLPSKVEASQSAAEDWRMAIAWGRTLVCLAEERLIRNHDEEAERRSPRFSSFDPPVWPRDSPFSSLSAHRPPVTRRMSLSGSSPHEILLLAIDQFSRGILHMPHPRSSPSTSTGTSPRGSPQFNHVVIASTPTPQESLSISRPKILFTVATELLAVAERLPSASEREYWSQWADGVFSQMEIEADMADWMYAVAEGRGRCSLIVGSAKAEPLEPALEDGDEAVLEGQDAQEAREALEAAITHFDNARDLSASSSVTIPLDHGLGDLQPLLAEALITLANLTTDPLKQEALYARAKAEGVDAIELGEDEEGDVMDESR